jgi:mRNA interferase RelE/StbE
VTAGSWRVVVAPSADRALGRLPEKVAAAVVEFMLGTLREAPRRVGHPLRGDLSGLWAARRGVYRIVYELDDATRSILVLRIDHRADVYRHR